MAQLKDLLVTGDARIVGNLYTTIAPSQIINIVYPVGSIYMSVNNTNPSTFIGGTWVAWGSGKVPVGVDTGQTEFNSVEKTGGAKTASTSYTPAGTNTGGAVSAHTYTPAGKNTGTAVTMNAVELTHSGGAVQSHTLTVAEIPSHDHIIYTPRYYYSEPGGGGDILGVDSNQVTTVQERKTDVKGGGGGHNHGFTQPSKHSFTPTTKSITQPTFSGTQATLSHTVTNPTFSGTAATITESTIQPYITCYMWKRTA